MSGSGRAAMPATEVRRGSLALDERVKDCDELVVEVDVQRAAPFRPIEDVHHDAADHPPTVSQLDRDLGYPRQVIQRKTNELIDRGLLSMTDNPANRRACVLVTTRKGLELKAIADEWAKLASAELLTNLEPGLCEKITADLKILCVAIDGRNSNDGSRNSEKS